MTRLHMLVEGQSEETFVKQTLSPYLAQFDIFVSPILLWTKRLANGGGYRGGVSTWQQIRQNLQPLLSDSHAWVTTLLDYYGLPEDFPGYQEALKAESPSNGVVMLESYFTNEFKHTRFIPFFALHELEAWIFCAPDIVAAHFGKPGLNKKLGEIVSYYGQPELINHGVQTHPKARLLSLCSYKETSDGPIILGKIGITQIRAACPHFAQWLKRIENISGANPSN